MMEVCPNVVVPDDVTDNGWWFHEWETFADTAQLAYDNGLAFIEYLRTNYADTDERVAAVSHGGSGSKFLEALFAIPDTSYTRFAHHNTAVSKIIITTDQVRLRYLNRIDHLPEEAVT
jgi:2,3-bisphosphoglycerate-dependent phosphoglycerate mutase